MEETVDVYALGVLLFEALTGQLPFPSDDDPVKVMTTKLTLQPPAASELVDGVPPDLDELIAALLARSPTDRPSIALPGRVVNVHEWSISLPIGGIRPQRPKRPPEKPRQIGLAPPLQYPSAWHAFSPAFRPSPSSRARRRLLRYRSRRASLKRFLSVAPEPVIDTSERYSIVPTVTVRSSVNPSIPPKEVSANVSIMPASRDYFVTPDSTQDMVPVVDFDDSVRGVFVATHEVVPVGSKIQIWVDEGVEVTGTVAFRRDPQDHMWPGLGVLLSEEDAARVCSFVNHRHTFFYPMESLAPPGMGC